jgi:hypothetical protein
MIRRTYFELSPERHESWSNSINEIDAELKI